MHEYSVALSLLDSVALQATENGAASVQHIRVRLGELSGVDPQLLVSAYDICRQSSEYPEAKLEIVSVPARWGCQRCGTELSAGSILRCGQCQVPATLLEGDEIVLDRLEMEIN